MQGFRSFELSSKLRGPLVTQPGAASGVMVEPDSLNLQNPTVGGQHKAHLSSCPSNNSPTQGVVLLAQLEDVTRARG